MPATKIATCCYCGTRAALVLRGKVQHELSCGSCGAPLHDLKIMPMSDHAKRPSRVAPSRIRTEKPVKPRYDPRHDDRKKRKKRKDWLSDFVEEAWDVVEDIFD